MKPNVFIVGRERGKRVYHWEGHNTWTEAGRNYLANLICSNTPLEESRLKHIAFGIGSVHQGVALDPAVDAAYPAGFDPHATAGNEYNHRFPLEPLISTLERPVRLTGGTNPYDTAAPSDVWLSDPTPPKFLMTLPSPGSVTLRYFLEPGVDIIYAPFTAMPLTEMGLATNAAATDVNTPFNTVVAYVNFDTLMLTSSIEVEVAWEVNF